MMTIYQKSDTVGAMTSTLCLIHCLVTPFIFIVQSCTQACCSSESIPVWWIALDYIFLGISFFAILWSSKTSSKKWMSYAMWLAWSTLLFVILNERLGWIKLTKNLNYIPALSLVVLHLYNRKYCKCEADKCCTTEG